MYITDTFEEDICRRILRVPHNEELQVRNLGIELKIVFNEQFRSLTFIFISQEDLNLYKLHDRIKEGMYITFEIEKKQMKKLIKQTKEDLVKEIERLQKTVRTLVNSLITIIVLVPWTAIFLGQHVNLVYSAYSILFSLWFVQYLKRKKIL